VKARKAAPGFLTRWGRRRGKCCLELLLSDFPEVFFLGKGSDDVTKRGKKLNIEGGIGEPRGGERSGRPVRRGVLFR
jgi:hypothetical protein